MKQEYDCNGKFQRRMQRFEGRSTYMEGFDAVTPGVFLPLLRVCSIVVVVVVIRYVALRCIMKMEI